MSDSTIPAIEEFFDQDLAPMVRRMVDRPRSAGGESDDSNEIRAMVWEGLVKLGALDSPDTTRLAELLGMMLYQGPLLDTLTARELFPDVVVGHEPAAVSVSEQPWTIREDGSVVARRTFVGFAADVDHLVVCGTDATGIRVALVPTRHPSMSMRRFEEIGRGEEYGIELDGTPVTAWAPEPAWEAALAGARIRQAAYLVGLAQAALDHAVEYAKTRRQFGQPIGKSQSLAFRLSEMSMNIDATRLLVHDHDAATHAAANLAAASDLARTVTMQTMQVRGAVSMLDSDDAQLFLRKAAVESMRLGNSADLRRQTSNITGAAG